jgi:hypothetical protein
VGASLALLVGTVTVPGVNSFLGLLSPSLLGWGVVGASSAGAVAISRAIGAVQARSAVRGP